jgi:predicted small lipoprotein YifL
VKRLLAASLALMLVLPLAACGRKGDPEAPPNVDPRFPRSYPGSAPRAPAPPPTIDDNFIPRTTP